MSLEYIREKIGEGYEVEVTLSTHRNYCEVTLYTQSAADRASVPLTDWPELEKLLWKKK